MAAELVTQHSQSTGILHMRARRRFAPVAQGEERDPSPAPAAANSRLLVSASERGCDRRTRARRAAEANRGVCTIDPAVLVTRAKAATADETSAAKSAFPASSRTFPVYDVRDVGDPTLRVLSRELFSIPGLFPAMRPGRNRRRGIGEQSRSGSVDRSGRSTQTRCLAQGPGRSGRGDDDLTARCSRTRGLTQRDTPETHVRACGSSRRLRAPLLSIPVCTTRRTRQSGHPSPLLRRTRQAAEEGLDSSDV